MPLVSLKVQDIRLSAMQIDSGTKKQPVTAVESVGKGSGISFAPSTGGFVNSLYSASFIESY
jgi:hypothetical protein